ncbi:zinc-binding protein A33-like [Acipenser ruthenus]|uniref:zinc-binding protein A33-like n=1 Tax=Acipenser ruthenus TaxID=7906 RepID=UPI0027425231|nr:zinc-binding protein A33-like [Acipenser ruthenus]
MDSASNLEKLHSKLTCPICLELFKEPVHLACGDHFCMPCISQLWEKCEESFSCPQCGKTFEDRSLETSPLLGNVVESVREMRLGSKHDSQCEEHEEKLKLFCEDDQRAICVVCGCSREHKTHNVIPIKEAFQSYKENMSESLQKIHKLLKEVCESQDQTVCAINNMKELAGSLEEQIGADFTKMHQFLEQQEGELKSKLRDEEKKILNQLEESKTLIEAERSRLQQAAKDLEETLTLQETPALLKDIKDLLSRITMTYQKPKCVSSDQCLGKYGGPLMYGVWKKMRNILDLVAFPVSLNPNTANPWLVLSDSQSCVKLGEVKQALPDIPERFDSVGAVLGSEGFSTGRHYWEVEVGEKTMWGLGVVRESVNRKGEMTSSPKDGLWILALRNGNEYKAYTLPCTLLPVQRKPTKIGVFLDHERGQVSFYNAEDMVHLYTFRDTFTEKIYPYLCPGIGDKGRNKQPLNIFKLQV